MAVSLTNILHGTCTVAFGAALTDVGFTLGGVTIRKSRDLLDVEADQLAGVGSKKVISERMFVTFTMLEVTEANMRIAMDEAAVLIFGTAAPSVTEQILTITGAGVAGQTRTYTFHRACLVEDVEHRVGGRDAVGTLPVTFELLKESSSSYNFGTYADA